MPKLKALSGAVVRLLRPLVRILIRNGMPYGAFADLAKQVYVELAMTEFAISGRKPSVSRASVITGLSRKEVLRVQRLPSQDDAALAERYNRGARVISGWARDADFVDSRRQPLALSLDGPIPSFTELVKRHSGDVPVRAILDELLRVGAVERRADGQLRLLTPAYVPAGGELEKIGILGTDVAYLVSTIDHNLACARTEARFQRKVAYDNLSEEAVVEFRPLVSERAQALLELLDAWLSARDRDVRPDIGGTGRKRAGLGIYYFEEGVTAESDEQREQT